MITTERFACFILLTVLCTASISAGQAPTGAPPPAASTKIYLDVVVSPKSGPPVADLQQQDFTLLDNKSPQPITSFQAFTGREAPIKVVLLIDAVNSGTQRVGYERIQIDKFLRAEGGHLAYPVALAVFTDKGISIAADLSSDGNALSEALDKSSIAIRAIGASAGFYGAAERLQYSLAALHQLTASLARQPGRKVVIWVSPGWPLLSGPRVELTSKQQQQIFSDVVSFSTQLRQAGITLYSVNPVGNGESMSRASYYKDFLKAVSKPSQVNAGNLGLPVLAIQSGGLAFELNNDLAAMLQQCVSDTAPYYEISFDSAPADRPDEHHQLEVKLAKPDLIARMRQGYYAQPLPKN
ncbi:MAG: VWA domain-containing protein [Candidatus Acidiferrales bacterium]